MTKTCEQKGISQQTLGGFSKLSGPRIYEKAPKPVVLMIPIPPGTDWYIVGYGSVLCRVTLTSPVPLQIPQLEMTGFGPFQRSGKEWEMHLRQSNWFASAAGSGHPRYRWPRKGREGEECIRSGVTRSHPRRAWPRTGDATPLKRNKTRHFQLRNFQWQRAC